MRTRTLLVALATMASLALMSACTTPGAKPLSPAQVAAIACPQLNVAHTQLVALNTALAADPATAAAGAAGAKQLAAVHPIVAAVCNGNLAAAGVDASSIAALVQTGLPALSNLANTLPLAPAQRAQLQTGLVAAQIAVGLVGAAQQAQAAQAAQSTAPAASAAQP
jgi:hypothetical protein